MWKKITISLLMVLLGILSKPNILAGSAALYAFGDSTVDVGNNNFLPGAPKANFLPYGVDYPGRTPTGRFTNGFNSADYIAQAMGLATSPPPFLSRGSGTRGVNFASGGSGILDSTGQGVISMGAQVRDFGRVAMELTARMGNQSASAFLAQSLFFFRVGSNDLFLQSSGGRPKDQIVNLLINNFRDQLSTLYNFGARKFAVMGTGLIGCTPGRRISNPSGDCNEDLNALSFRFKTATKALLQDLGTSLQGFQYSFGDLYEATARIYANPLAFGDHPHPTQNTVIDQAQDLIASFLQTVCLNGGCMFDLSAGFTEIKAACCGGGRLNASSGCAQSTAYCSNRGQYFFWDAVHSTQAGYKLQVAMSFRETPLLSNSANAHQWDTWT